MVTIRFKASSYFEGSSGRCSLGYLKNRVRGDAASVHCGNLSDPRTEPRIVANSIRAPQSAGAWSTLSPTSPNGYSVRDRGLLGESSTLHTTLVYNDDEGLVCITVGTVRTFPNVFHELWGCSGGFAIKGDGNSGSLQEFEL